ncbi:thioredoxin reductase [Aneurinibacillus soli]|uniref:Thioredoxin reductase n=1 Tax=Aneurinibacillus soli TaxID=1500254 RepID=A0A0U5B2U4_9BACL|nr:NAD(P)/FAD-dependent oxidoreductase [Aneurinibacillus soli]PYE63011.1 thioredoxin reductase [Aneurinibacillus soli]BAU28930.1 Thioredoxin reductase [Aneurinibacillus soli]
MYDCAIIGGGIAGLQAAIQLGRYMHRVVVFDAHGGRSVLAKKYSNIIGFENGVSGPSLREIGHKQARTYETVEFVNARVTEARRLSDEYFELRTDDGQAVQAQRVLLSTGLSDRLPEEIEGLHEVLGSAIYLCPDCDGYEVRGRVCAILGAGDVGAALACTLRYWTDQLIYINHEPDENLISASLRSRCEQAGVAIYEGKIQAVHVQDAEHLSAVELADGTRIKAEKGFVAFGGVHVESDLAEMLGVKRLENGHIPVDGRTKETNVPGVWAAGDVTVHSQLLTVAIGDGAQSAIWIHKSLQDDNR